MADTKKAKKESFIEKVEHAVVDVEKKVVKAVKNVEHKIEEAIEHAAEAAVGDTGSIVVEEKEKKATKKKHAEEKHEEHHAKEEHKEHAHHTEAHHEKKTEHAHSEKKVLTAEDKKVKLAQLMEKAKKLEKSVTEVKDVDLKKKVKAEEEEKKDTLVPMEDYLKSSIHLGTRVITPDMRKYVYRRRADGLAVFNTALLDDKMREGAAYLSQFDPKDIIIVCKREAGWTAVKKFAETLGIRSFMKKYPAGILTNTQLEKFTEAEMVFICDPWLDKNALSEATNVGIPVLSICDTNNFTAGITQVIPGNNKSNKSLGMIFYLLTKQFIETRGLDITPPAIQEFVEGWDELVPPK